MTDNKEWLENNMEVMTLNKGFAEILIPQKLKLLVHEDEKGFFVVYEDLKLYSKHLEAN